MAVSREIALWLVGTNILPLHHGTCGSINGCTIMLPGVNAAGNISCEERRATAAQSLKATPFAQPRAVGEQLVFRREFSRWALLVGSYLA